MRARQRAVAARRRALARREARALEARRERYQRRQAPRLAVASALAARATADVGVLYRALAFRLTRREIRAALRALGAEARTFANHSSAEHTRKAWVRKLGRAETFTTWSLPACRCGRLPLPNGVGRRDGEALHTTEFCT